MGLLTKKLSLPFSQILTSGAPPLDLLPQITFSLGPLHVSSPAGNHGQLWMASGGLWSCSAMLGYLERSRTHTLSVNHLNQMTIHSSQNECTPPGPLVAN